MQRLLAGLSNLQPSACVQLRIAVNVAQHKIVNLFKTLWDFFVITYLNVFNVWPKTVLLLPMWPRYTKMLDNPGRESSLQIQITIYACWQVCRWYGKGLDIDGFRGSCGASKRERKGRICGPRRWDRARHLNLRREELGKYQCKGTPTASCAHLYLHWVLTVSSHCTYLLLYYSKSN